MHMVCATLYYVQSRFADDNRQKSGHIFFAVSYTGTTRAIRPIFVAPGDPQVCPPIRTNVVRGKKSFFL